MNSQLLVTTMLKRALLIKYGHMGNLTVPCR